MDLSNFQKLALCCMLAKVTPRPGNLSRFISDYIDEIIEAKTLKDIPSEILILAQKANSHRLNSPISALLDFLEENGRIYAFKKVFKLLPKNNSFKKGNIEEFKKKFLPGPTDRHLSIPYICNGKVETLDMTITKATEDIDIVYMCNMAKDSYSKSDYNLYKAAMKVMINLIKKEIEDRENKKEIGKTAKKSYSDTHTLIDIQKQIDKSKDKSKLKITDSINRKQQSVDTLKTKLGQTEGDEKEKLEKRLGSLVKKQTELLDTLKNLEKEEYEELKRYYNHEGDTVINGILRGNYLITDKITENGEIVVKIKDKSKITDKKIYTISPRIYAKKMSEIYSFIDKIKSEDYDEYSTYNNELFKTDISKYEKEESKSSSSEIRYLFRGTGPNNLFNRLCKNKKTEANNKTEAVFKAIKENLNTTITFNDFLSTARTPTIARGFVKNYGFLWIIKVDISKHKNLSNITKTENLVHTSEDETLISPPTKLKIVGAVFNGEKIGNIKAHEERIIEINSFSVAKDRVGFLVTELIE